MTGAVDKDLPFPLSRRRVLAGVAAMALLGPVTNVGARSVRTVAMPTILPRSAWDGGDGPAGELENEDVKFLLVHHTAEPGNDYGEDDVVGLLRGIYRFHTGPSKGWPDIAYNFMIDKFGRIFEARSGSIAGPVRGSATGGNQGYSQLCCFLGNFAAESPTPEAQASMVDLLSWLTDRYGVPVGSGTTVEFTSLGSSRWPTGETVRVDPIAAHRDVSETTCPGDACIDLVRVAFPAAVSARLAPPSSTPATTATTAPTTATTAPTTATTAPTTATSARSALGAAAPDNGGEVAAGSQTTTPTGDVATVLGVAAVAVATAGAAGLAAVEFRKRRTEPRDPDSPT